MSIFMGKNYKTQPAMKLVKNKISLLLTMVVVIGVGINTAQAQSCSGPISLPYFQDWESGNSLSDYPCWAQKYGGSSSFDDAEIDDGQFNVGGAFSGSNTLMLNDGADAISPEIIQLPSGNIEMSFYASFEDFYDEPFEIGVVDQQPSSPSGSYNNYTTYQKFTYVNSNPSTNNFEFTNDETYRKYTITFDNTSKIGNKKYIVFNRDNSTSGETGIEDIDIKLLLKRNLAPNAIKSPSSQCAFPNGDSVRVEYQSQGSQTLSKNTSFPVSYTFQGNQVTETHTVQSDVKQGGTFTHTFNTKVNPNQDNQNYQISASVNWSQDQNSGNDNFSGSFRNEFTPSKPGSATGDTVCNGERANLTLDNPSQKTTVKYQWYADRKLGNVVGNGAQITTSSVSTSGPSDSFYVRRLDSFATTPLKISEVKQEGDEGVEVQHTLNTTKDYSGYTVAWASGVDPGDVELTWNLGSFDPYEAKFGIESGFGFGCCGSTFDDVAALIVDPNGNVVDFFAAFDDNDVTDIDYNINGANITYSDVKWNGSSRANDGDDGFRRVGNSDNNDASDWKVEGRTPGKVNPEYNPFPTCPGEPRAVGIKVNPVPNPGFEASKDTVCATTPVTFNDTSSVDFGSASFTYNWNVGNDQLSGSSPQYTFPQSQGSYNIQLDVETQNGCRDSITSQVQVNANPEPAIADIEACAGKQTQLRDSTTFPGFGDLSYQWTVQNSNYQSVNPVHTFSASATNEVELAVTSNKGCSDTVTQQADILPTPDVQYSVSDACAGDQVQFNDNTGFSGSVSNLTYNWSFGDRAGSTNPSATHTYDTLGAYDTRLIVRSEDGCVDTANRQVTINGLPDPDFTFENTCDPKAVDLTNTTKFGGDAANLDYTWDLEGNSVNVEEATYTFSDAQTYQVELQATNTNGNCVNTITQDVDVKPQPTADFSVSDVCVGEEASFNYTGNNPAPSYNWDLATTTSTMENPAVAYDNPGSYDVSLTVNYYDGECVKDTMQTLAVNPVPTADFAFGKEGGVCAGEEVQFVNNTTFENGDMNTLTYDWAVGSTGLSGESPVFPFDNEGTFDVELTARSTEGCETTFSLTKVVNPLPVSDFTLEQTGPDEVRLSPQDNTYPDYTWNLGDSTTVTAPSATYTYDSNGTYNITLTVEDRAGCSSTSSEELVLETVGIGDQPETASSKIEAYPNPFQNVARINYSVEQQADVQLEVYTANGQNLVTETYNDRPAGSYSFNLKADRSLPTGATYLIRLQIGDKVYTKELIQQR